MAPNSLTNEDGLRSTASSSHSIASSSTAYTGCSSLTEEKNVHTPRLADKLPPELLCHISRYRLAGYHRDGSWSTSSGDYTAVIGLLSMFAVSGVRWLWGCHHSGLISISDIFGEEAVHIFIKRS
ncbi:hypothetical protein AcW1_007386 [Taiwanofungus camphoratus]|nr:hypothetical protein AcW2_007548 [Antrodia cinnamomea]KAI0920104.1 hypothetical protein AcV7_006095 [Antrodia cinnamomea]KAI0927344.1 hypothetical protein AcV5_007901 [Antrodia cinnamomea]KAI0953067.1 hypothetical protein AcW1_007386 [Antrodia cinnamomea]